MMDVVEGERREEVRGEGESIAHQKDIIFGVLCERKGWRRSKRGISLIMIFTFMFFFSPAEVKCIET
jgi:hypothetical protein